MRKRQYLYILSNPSMPGLLKIGKTKDHPSQRMAKLHSSGVPTPFVLEFSCVVQDCSTTERLAHSALESYRVALNREFFNISVNTALKKILPVIGNCKIEYRKGETGPQCRNNASENKRGILKTTKNAAEAKSVMTRQKPRKTGVIAPSEWPFPTSSRP